MTSLLNFGTNQRFVELLYLNKHAELSYHGADHTADVDGVTASRHIVSWVSKVFAVKVQNFQTNFHHVILKLERQSEGREFTPHEG